MIKLFNLELTESRLLAPTHFNTIHWLTVEIYNIVWIEKKKKIFKFVLWFSLFLVLNNNSVLLAHFLLDSLKDKIINFSKKIKISELVKTVVF